VLRPIEDLNLVLRFCIEMALLGIAGVWAWRTVQGRNLRLVATVCLPLLVAMIWGSVVHGAGVPGSVQLATQVVLFALGTVALIRIQRHNLAVIFGTLTAVNAALMVLWAQ
jgi:hypothetical protein